MPQPRVPGWEVENQLAKELGFECVKDKRRGFGWCKFVRGEWHVWEIADPDTFGAHCHWQVARLKHDEYCEHYYLPGCGWKPFSELRAALEYAKQKGTFDELERVHSQAT
jgi:hypothetical protein